MWGVLPIRVRMEVIALSLAITNHYETSPDITEAGCHNKRESVTMVQSSLDGTTTGMTVYIRILFLQQQKPVSAFQAIQLY